MYSTCQRCFKSNEITWTIRQAEFHIGKIDHWKVQLCQPCTKRVEQVLLGALAVASQEAQDSHDDPL